ncbi:hypothetical protein CpipJ_CPIJ010953 [Culex quinquefasciatus]|uniref:Uncharacterized protein n=1 Tax=Culex quinquefasciatus TaxID=7176 RepID=B0WU57_CULQU|nr:hypothetical protein CpipJ_CPIJ010953 [Culex quinquefasciatus]|eukprot:XP_001870908.1 hypothetical protein CpipJ_CPIJ010953 [Culex quinquefasciatus]
MAVAKQRTSWGPEQQQQEVVRRSSCRPYWFEPSSSRTRPVPVGSVSNFDAFLEGICPDERLGDTGKNLHQSIRDFVAGISVRRRREGRKVLSCRSGAKVFSALGVWEPSGITGKDCPPWEARNFRRKSKPLLDTIFAGQDIAQGKESESSVLVRTVQQPDKTGPSRLGA